MEATRNIVLGRIGRAVATRAAGLEMSVIATETCPDIEFVERHHIEVAREVYVYEDRISEIALMHIERQIRHFIARPVRC